MPKGAASSAAAPRKRASASQARGYAPTSLNLAVRKKETERIERENHAFAKRLFDKKAVVAKKNLDADYRAHLRYKGQIAKMTGQVPVKPRAMTRGMAASGLSNSNLMMSADDYPQ